MILRSNLPNLREFGGRSARVLDAGGWYRPFNLATHVIDLNPYESRRVDDALDPEDDERFTADTWIVQDVCNSPWPFPERLRLLQRGEMAAARHDTRALPHAPPPALPILGAASRCRSRRTTP